MSRKKSNGPLRSLCRACLGLIAAWWRADRVRISPRAGQLLRLRPNSLVFIRGQTVEVLTRQESQASDEHRICYECRTEIGPARLDVRIRADAGRLEIRWFDSGQIELLEEHQIEVFS